MCISPIHRGEVKGGKRDWGGKIIPVFFWHIYFLSAPTTSVVVRLRGLTFNLEVLGSNPRRWNFPTFPFSDKHGCKRTCQKFPKNFQAWELEAALCVIEWLTQKTSMRKIWVDWDYSLNKILQIKKNPIPAEASKFCQATWGLSANEALIWTKKDFKTGPENAHPKHIHPCLVLILTASHNRPFSH